MVTRRICGIEKDLNLAPLVGAPFHDPFINPGLVKKLIMTTLGLHMNDMPDHDGSLSSKTPRQKLAEKKKPQKRKNEGTDPKSCSLPHLILIFD